MFKKGDKAVCITNRFQHITKGKVYEIYDIAYSEGKPKIVTEYGVYCDFEWFELAEESGGKYV